MKVNNFTPTRRAPDMQQMDNQLREASRLYEQQFLGEMVKAMKSTVHQGDGLIPTNMAQNVFRDQMDQKTVEEWSHRGGVGLADIIYQQVKEKYFPEAPPPKLPMGAFPAEQAKEPKFQLKMDQSQFRLRKDPNWQYDGSIKVQSPWEGRISHAEQDGPWSTIRVEHPFGGTSILGFNGANHAKVGDFVQAGQALGDLPNFGPNFSEKNGPDLMWKIHKNASV